MAVIAYFGTTPTQTSTRYVEYPDSYRSELGGRLCPPEVEYGLDDQPIVIQDI